MAAGRHRCINVRAGGLCQATAIEGERRKRAAMSESTSATTLVAAIEQLPVAVGRSFTFVDAAGAETAVGFPDLHATVARRHAQLAELGVRRGDRVAVVLPDAADFVPTFLGAVRGGAVPVPLYPPVALGRLDAYLDGLTAMLRVAAPTLLCTGSALRNVLASLLARVPSLRAVVAVDGLPEPTAAPAAASVTPDETALLQFTSGSTAHPKGVVVPHGSLAANAEIIMRHALGVGPEDSCSRGSTGSTASAPPSPSRPTSPMPGSAGGCRPRRWLAGICPACGFSAAGPSRSAPTPCVRSWTRLVRRACGRSRSFPATAWRRRRWPWRLPVRRSCCGLTPWTPRRTGCRGRRCR